MLAAVLGPALGYQPEPRTSLAPPTPDEAIAAFNTVEPWIRAGGVPDQTQAFDLAAASLLLRLDGAVIGRGTAADAGCLYVSTDAALQEASERLPKRDALQAELAPSDFNRLTISLELAGPLIPFSPTTFEDVDAEISPGLEGVGARAGSRLELVFPATMLTWNTTPAEALASAISKATGDATLAIRGTPAGEPGAIAKDRAITYYRFRVTHLAQSSPGRTPIFLHRGGRIVAQSFLDSFSLRAWADGLAGNLQGRCIPGPHVRADLKAPLTVRGTYWPATGKYDPAEAGPIEQILVARALDRYSLMRGRDSAQGRRARASSAQILVSLGLIPIGKGGPDSSPASAALWSAALVQSDAATITDWLGPLGEMILACRDILDAAAKDISTVPPPQRAVVAFALARRAREKWPGIPAAPEPGARDKANAGPAGLINTRATLEVLALIPRIPDARRAIDATYAETPPGNLVTQMPWLGWGDQYLSEDSIAAAPSLRDMREQVYSHCLTLETAGSGNEDLIGGILFTSSRSPAPTSQAVRPAAFLASALGDPRLTDPAEIMKELSRHLTVLRFLRQLTADESLAWMCQDPDAALWGVRAAPWDQRQTPEATAMTLITVCETLRSLDEIARRQTGAPR